MNSDAAGCIAWFGLMVLPLFFWGRGIVRGRKDDLRAGMVIFTVVCLLFLATADFLEVLTIPLVSFSMVTLIAGCFAKPDCPLSPSRRSWIIFVTLFLGLLMGLFV